MKRVGKARRSGHRVLRWLGVVGVVMAGAGGILASERGESAPARREQAIEVPVASAGGGIAAELPSDVHAVAIATIGPDGELKLDCTDPETAAQLVAEVTP